MATDTLIGKAGARLPVMALALLLAGVLVLLASSPAAADAPRIVAIDSNTYDSAALFDNGTLWTWGLNDYGQLGTGDRVNASAPVQAKISDVKAFWLGPQEWVALTGDDTVWFCGNDIVGYMNDPNFPESTTPVPVGSITGAKSVALDLLGGYILVLKGDGTVWEVDWKDNSTMQVPITGVVAIDADVHHVAALKGDGTVWSWGRGTSGQVGNGRLNDSAVPTEASISGVVAIDCGYDHTMAVRSDGTVWGWGDNLEDVLGNATCTEVNGEDFEAVPVQVEDLRNVVAVAAGSTHTVALKSDGTVWSWGDNNEGLAGNGVYSSDQPIVYPVQVIGLANVTQIAASYSHSLALRSDGTVWAWGRNAEGELGIGRVTDSPANGMGTITGEAVPQQVKLGPAASLSVNATQQLPPSFGTLQPTPSLSGIPTISPGGTAQENWTLDVGGSPLYIGLVTDGAIYAYRGNDIYCISPEGAVLWNATVPDRWKLLVERRSSNGNTFYVETPQPVMCAADGCLYVYVMPSSESNVVDPVLGDPANASCEGDGWDVMAIGPDGQIRWTVPLPTVLQPSDDTSLQAKNGRIYVFHSYNETVLDPDGTVLFTVQDISDPCAVDEAGNLYAALATPGGLPGSIIVSYAPGGTLRWQKALGENVIRQDMIGDARLEFDTLPLYQNGSLYVPLRRGVLALDTNGSERWSRQFGDGLYVLFGLMPVDSAGNVYVANVGNCQALPLGVASSVYVISPDGRDVSPPRSFTAGYGFSNHYAAQGGVVYMTTRVPGDYDNFTLDDLATFVVSAYDLRNGTYLWNYTLPTADRHSIVLTKENVEGVFGPYAGTLDDPVDYTLTLPPDVPAMNLIWPSVSVYPAGDRVYVEFHSATYQVPVVYGQSQCVYTSGIFVIGTGGSIISGQQLGTVITSMAVSNGTVYYGTGNGQIASAALIGVASGIVALAAALLFLKFIGFGFVARARSRLDRNDNRNQVLRLVAASPGCTHYEIARALGLNLGTVRYHLMILGINHRLATYRDGTRRVRYFTNAGTYTREQMRLIALLRREPVSKLLRALSGTGSMTNSALAAACGLPESDVSRLLKELTADGITVREALPGEKPAYRIAEGMERQVAGAFRQMGVQSQNWPAAEASPA